MIVIHLRVSESFRQEERRSETLLKQHNGDLEKDEYCKIPHPTAWLDIKHVLWACQEIKCMEKSAK